MSRVEFGRLSLEAFLPFRESVSVQFANAGLVHVRGQNRVSSAADSNGSGKSALASDGSAWVLYGETLRGLRGDAVVCRQALPRSSCVGSLELRVGEEELVLRRTARPTSLQLVDGGGKVLLPDLGVRDLQAHVESILGFGLRTYRNAVVFGQGQFDRFAQADQAEQLRMLDEIQGLDFRAALERARVWAREAREALDAVDREAAHAEAEARRATERVEDLARARGAWVAEKGRRQAQAQAALGRAETALAQSRESLARAEAARVRLPVLRDRHRQRFAAEALFSSASAARDAAKHDVEARQSIVRSLAREVSLLLSVASEYERDREARVRACQSRVAGTEATLASARADFADADAARDQVPVAEAACAEYVRLQGEVSATEAELARAQAFAESARRDLASVERHVDDLLAHGECPTCRSVFNAVEVERIRVVFQPEVAAAANRATAASTAASSAQTRLDDARGRFAAAQEWTPVTLASLKARAARAVHCAKAVVVAGRDCAQADAALAEATSSQFDEGPLLTARADLNVAEVALAAAQARESEAVAAVVCAKLPDGEDAASLARQIVAAEVVASDDAMVRARRAVESAGEDLRSAQVACESLFVEAWSAQPLLDAALAERDVASERFAVELPARRRRAEVTVVVAEYWVEAFGDRGIRSLMFDSVAGFLNDRLAHHLSALAAGEVSVVASALASLKGGGQRERLSVVADWRWGGAGRGAGSAGQDRRVDLALFAALQDLAESRSARSFPIKVYDEPGDALDARGQELFARWVEREAGRRSTTLLVTHSQQLAEEVRADQTWTVVMDERGARVEVGR